MVSAWKAKGIMQQAASKFACSTNLRGLKKKLSYREKRQEKAEMRWFEPPLTGKAHSPKIQS